HNKKREELGTCPTRRGRGVGVAEDRQEEEGLEEEKQEEEEEEEEYTETHDENGESYGEEPTVDDPQDPKPTSPPNPSTHRTLLPRDPGMPRFGQRIIPAPEPGK
ncbi:MAG: hypothetical protein LQ346_009120, partial [Caloplaca aetnensis]